MKLFYILIMVVVTQICKFLKIHRTVQQKMSILLFGDLEDKSLKITIRNHWIPTGKHKMKIIDPKYEWWSKEHITLIYCIWDVKSTMKLENHLLISLKVKIHTLWPRNSTLIIYLRWMKAFFYKKTSWMNMNVNGIFIHSRNN